MPESLYHRIGGRDAVDKVVEIFYEKVLADPRVSKFFEGVDMEKQIAKQKAFLAVAFGGAPSYPGKKLSEAHAHLVKQGLDDTHFDAIAENLKNALVDYGTSNEIIEEVLTIVESTRDDVLGRAGVS